MPIAVTNHLWQHFRKVQGDFGVGAWDMLDSAEASSPVDRFTGEEIMEKHDSILEFAGWRPAA